MRINELPLIADFSATDYAGVDNGTATRKINLAGIISGIKTRLTTAETNISNKVDKSDALLNLDTTQAPTTTDGALYEAITNIGWTGVISNQLLELKELLTKVLERLNAVGTVYQASWTATSSSGLNTQLTNDITLPAGTYIVVLTTPTISANCSINFGGSSCQFTAAGDAKPLIYKTSNTVSIHAYTSQSAAVTFSNITRGGLMAVRIA